VLLAVPGAPPIPLLFPLSTSPPKPLYWRLAAIAVASTPAAITAFLEPYATSLRSARHTSLACMPLCNITALSRLRCCLPLQSSFGTINGEGLLIKITKLGEDGLRSVDRNNKATLPLTRPYHTIKSYAKVLSLRIVKLQDVS
jgi:hypothetical protein